jgi:uncharacterized cupin superfamily protein
VISGTPTLRTPAGEQPLSPGDVVSFPDGPAGAHTVKGPGRILMFSVGRAQDDTSISAYPDSDKLGTRPAGRPGVGPDRLNFRRGDSVDYWEGE